LIFYLKTRITTFNLKKKNTEKNVQRVVMLFLYLPSVMFYHNSKRDGQKRVPLSQLCLDNCV